MLFLFNLFLLAGANRLISFWFFFWFFVLGGLKLVTFFLESFGFFLVFFPWFNTGLGPV